MVCPAYCFSRDDYRLFRCDRMLSVVYETEPAVLKPLDLRHVHLGNWESFVKMKQELIRLEVELSIEGVQRCETELGRRIKLHIRKDGTGWLDHFTVKSDIPFLAKIFIGLGTEAIV
uniref:WYL domain-containing protein n=1 Tax=Paenibacillus psychroresistens TaxID=1778678 RepID=UPI001D03EF19|nr:WYL domain-containing protein [Paenibacillus psychroresistens]